MKKITFNRWSASFLLLALPLVAFGVGSRAQTDAKNLATSATERISVDSSDAEADGVSSNARTSSDGRYVVFESKASDLVTGDTNGLRDVFLRDRTLGTTERISIDSSENQVTGESFAPVVSDDGRYVAFHSLANDLVASDTNNRVDVFVRDRTLGETKRVSVGPSAVQANDGSINASISADGNLIAYYSEATNLVAGDTNDVADVFVYNQTTSATTRISVDSTGTQSDKISFDPVISGNGAYVAFVSDATNLVSGDTNNCEDIFLHEISSGTTTRLSVHSNGTQANQTSTQPVISDDGLKVAFSSRASNIVDGDTNGYQDVFVRTWGSSTTERVSVDSSSQQISMNSSEPSLSGSGRFVTFTAQSSSVVAGDTNASSDIFLHDLATQAVVLISSDSSQVIGNSHSQNSEISGNGQYVVFESEATNLVASDANSKMDVFAKQNSIAFPIVSITAADVQVDEEVDTSVDFTFSRDSSTNVELTVNYSFSSSTATAGSDFTAPSGTVFFPIGVSDVDVNVTLINDSDIEVRESVQLDIVPGAEYVIQGNDSASTLIASGERPAVDIVTSKVFYEVGGPRLTTGKVEFKRATGLTAGQIVIPLNNISGTATSDSDYVPLPSEVVIPAGEESTTLEIEAIDDQDNEGVESIVFGLLESDDYIVGDLTWNKIYIMDNDQCSFAGRDLAACDFIGLFKQGLKTNEEFEKYFKVLEEK